MTVYELTSKQKAVLRKEGSVIITRNGKRIKVTPSLVKPSPNPSGRSKSSEDLIIDKIMALSKKLGKPTHWRNDLEIDKNEIRKYSPVHAVIWGVRDTGTHCIILRDVTYIPRKLKYFHEPGKEHSEAAMDIVNALTTETSNSWYYITPNTTRKISKANVINITKSWLKKSKDISVTL